MNELIFEVSEQKFSDFLQYQVLLNGMDGVNYFRVHVLKQIIAPEDGIIGLTFSKRVKTASENAFLYLKPK